jgi:hypothetical protein
VLFFDSTYSSLDIPAIQNWYNSSSDHVLKSVYRPGTGTERSSLELKQKLGGSRITVIATPSGANHWDLVRSYFPKVVRTFW